jgi:hypothetical protein
METEAEREHTIDAHHYCKYSQNDKEESEESEEEEEAEESEAAAEEESEEAEEEEEDGDGDADEDEESAAGRSIADRCCVSVCAYLGTLSIYIARSSR